MAVRPCAQKLQPVLDCCNHSAHSSEQLPSKQSVVGSNPTGGVTRHTAASGVLAQALQFFYCFVLSVEIGQNPCKPVRVMQNFTQISPAPVFGHHTGNLA